MAKMYRLLEPLTDGDGVTVLDAGEYLIDDGFTIEMYHPDSGEHFYVGDDEKESILDFVGSDEDGE